MSELVELLRATKLSDEANVPQGKLITIHESGTVADALELFTKNNISSCPVVDDDGDPWGMIDMLDIVAYTYEKLDPTHTGKTLEPRHVRQFLKKGPIKNLSYFSARSPWVVIPISFNFLKVRRFLSYPNIHRVYLTDQNSKPCGVITQKQFVRFLYEHKDNEGVKAFMKCQVSEVCPEPQKLRTVQQESPLRTAFAVIYKERVSGVAAVDFDGVLTGNVSATDLKRIKLTPDSFIEALGTITRKHLREKGKKPVVVEMTESVESMVQKMLDNDVRRVFVVDSDFKATRAISFCDIIAHFGHPMEEHFIGENSKVIRKFTE